DHGEPIRTCIGCRRRRPQRALVRIARTGEATLAIGRTLPGRGAWLCQDAPHCFDEAVRRGGFDRAFRDRIDADTIEALRLALNARGSADPTHFVLDTRPARD